MMPTAPYPQPQYPQQAQAPVTDGKAIASLVLGIVGCVGCLAVTGIPAIILGFIARGAIARSNGTRVGGGMALAGIITGFLSLAMSALALVLFLTVMGTAATKFQEAQVRNTKHSLVALHAVAEAWRASNPSDCPTPKRLRDDKELSASTNLNDPWGTPYAIECVGDDITAISYGPDRKAGTPDDIRYP